MLIAKREPATVVETPIKDFMAPRAMTQATWVAMMNIQRNRVNELGND